MKSLEKSDKAFQEVKITMEILRKANRTKNEDNDHYHDSLTKAAKAFSEWMIERQLSAPKGYPVWIGDLQTFGLEEHENNCILSLANGHILARLVDELLAQRNSADITAIVTGARTGIQKPL